MIQNSEFTTEEADNIKQSIREIGFLGDFDLSEDNLAMLHNAIIESNQQGYYDDVAIWEHKLFRPDPILCDGDGPLAKLRKWYNQFYEDAAMSSS